jgi:hypothetical protein
VSEKVVGKQAEHTLRRQLTAFSQTAPSQVNKPTDRPTMRWIFQCFEGIDLPIFAWEIDAKPRFWGYNLSINGFSVCLVLPFVNSIFSLRKLRNVGNISPQLERLSQQFGHQHREQLNTFTNGLLHIDASINKSPNSHLSHLSTLLQQQTDLQMQSAQTLQTMQATLKQSTISAQLQRLHDLYGRELEVQQTISASLKQIRDQLSTIVPLNQRDGSSQSGLRATDPNMPALPSQSNQHWRTEANSTPDPNTADLAD